MGKLFSLFHGDSCEVIKGIPDNSIDFGIHSPPFSNLYIYSDSEADMGNCATEEEFFKHYSFLIREMFRVTVPGRLCAVHCKDLPKYMGRDGEAGLIDFPGMIVQEFEDAGWTYHSHVTIWKCPVTERERTNNHGLLHKTVMADSSALRQGMADYLLVFRKNTMGALKSEKPVARPRGFDRFIGNPAFHPLANDYHPSPYARTGTRGLSAEDFESGMDLLSDSQHESMQINQSIVIWRRYAEPVWWDINQTDVLNHKVATSEKDEKHICPLQLDLIERAVNLWTNPGDVVFTPFAGIGSELVGAIRQDRKAIGIELKAEYFKWAIKNCNSAEIDATAPKLFHAIPESSSDENPLDSLGSLESLEAVTPDAHKPASRQPVIADI